MLEKIILKILIISAVFIITLLLIASRDGNVTITNISSLSYLKNVSDYINLEKSLCEDNVEIKNKPIQQFESNDCPKNGIITAYQGGRLGNQIWEYTSVHALARRTGLKAYVPKCMKSRLKKVFHNLTLPSIEEISHCRLITSFIVNNLTTWTPNVTKQSVILPRYITLPQEVLPLTPEIVAELTFRDDLKSATQEVLTKAVKHLTGTSGGKYTFVGIHVRRTDYVKYMFRRWKASPLTITYYHKAMTYFEKKYPDVIFVVVSDDSEWCLKTFGYKNNVYIASTKDSSPELDFVILASCNHTIIDYGSYGAWGAILAGGETVYYRIENHQTTGVAKILNNWINV